MNYLHKEKSPPDRNCLTAISGGEYGKRKSTCIHAEHSITRFAI